MKHVIYFLACIGGLCVICTILFFAIAISNSIACWRATRKEKKHEDVSDL